MHSPTIAAEAAKAGPSWAAALAVVTGISLNDWVLIATLLYTLLQISLSLPKLFKLFQRKD